MIVVNNSELLNSYISTTYSLNNDILFDYLIGINVNIYPNFHKQNFICLQYDTKLANWKMYCYPLHNWKLSDYFGDMIDTCLNKNAIYLAYIQISPLYEYDKVVFLQSIHLDHHVENYPLPDLGLHAICDIAIISPEGGIIHMDSIQSLDAIFFCFKFSVDHIHTILSNTDIQFEIINHFIEKIKTIEHEDCLFDYVSLFNKSYLNNREYFNKKMALFDETTYVFFKNYYECSDMDDFANLLEKFILNIRIHLVSELLMIYRRLILFPTEKKTIETYTKLFSPLMKLIDRIHNKYLETGSKINENDVESIFCTNNIEHIIDVKKFIIYDAPMMELIEYISNRGAIMNTLYDIFLDTTQKNVKPKYRHSIKCNYFPCHIFSPELFLMEHILVVG